MLTQFGNGLVRQGVTGGDIQISLGRAEGFLDYCSGDGACLSWKKMDFEMEKDVERDPNHALVQLLSDLLWVSLSPEVLLRLWCSLAFYGSC